MKSIKNKLLLLFTLLFTSLWSSCDDADYSTLENRAFIKEATESISGNITVDAEESTIAKLNIHLSKKSTQDSYYQLVVDTNVVHYYNITNGTNYIALPTDQYSLPDEIKIEKGNYNAEEVAIQLHPFTEEMNISGESYALPLKLISKNGSVPPMETTGSYLFLTSSVSKFSVPMFIGAANLRADKFGDMPETYNEYTVEVRFQVSNTDNRDRAIFKNAGDDTNFVLLRFEDPQKDEENHKAHSLVQVVGRNRVYLNPNQSFKPNLWQHLALTCDGSNYRLYINGVFAGVKEIPAGPTSFSDVNWFSGGDSGDSYWRGCKILMNEARIWSECRTETQIKNNISKVSPKSSNLEAYWKFNEGIGNEFKDLTGNGHTLKTSKDPQWIHDVLSTDKSTPWN